jgi:hypothetical protein
VRKAEREGREKKETKRERGRGERRGKREKGRREREEETIESF